MIDCVHYEQYQNSQCLLWLKNSFVIKSNDMFTHMVGLTPIWVYVDWYD